MSTLHQNTLQFNPNSMISNTGDQLSADFELLLLQVFCLAADSFSLY